MYRKDREDREDREDRDVDREGETRRRFIARSREGNPRRTDIDLDPDPGLDPPDDMPDPKPATTFVGDL